MPWASEAIQTLPRQVETFDLAVHPSREFRSQLGQRLFGAGYRVVIGVEGDLGNHFAQRIRRNDQLVIAIGGDCRFFDLGGHALKALLTR